MKFPTSRIGSMLPCLVVLLAFVSLTEVHGQAISCHSSVNVSLDQDCTYLLEPTDVLSQSNGGVYSVMLTTESGQIVSDITLRDIHLGTSLTAKITQSGNSCWGKIFVEDKLGPVISCTDRTVDCFDSNEYIPTAIDNCSQEATVELISQDFQDLDCGSNFTQLAIRRYQATDAFGNSSSCTQTLSRNVFDSNLVVYPESFKASTGSNLICGQVASTNGLPEVSLTGTPYVLLPDGDDIDTNPDTLSLFPYQDVFCNISVDYRDIVTNSVGCKKVIMRTWIINESCSTGTGINQVQTIEISDTEAPTVDCGAPFVNIPLSGQGCTGTFNVVLPSVSDDCSSFFGTSEDLEIDVRYAGGFVNNATQGFTIEVSGTDTITYIVYDDCGNVTTCTQEITLEDEAQPVAICDFNSVVSLRNDGTALVRPSTFDDGSFDNCEMIMSVIKRPETNCPCEQSELDGFDFIGEQNGSYFYISETGFNAETAYNLAEALEGRVAILNNSSVSTFLTSELNINLDSIYIGLTVSQGVLTWSDHSLLTGSGNWASGQLNPDGSLSQDGTNVILNENREWEVVTSGIRLPFILELTEPCGFTSKLEFCCADAGSNLSHTVELRAIDGAGNFGACTANVVVQDKVVPVITCPSDMSFNCDQSIDFTNKVLFGDCNFSDNCSMPSITGPTIDLANLNAQCNTGTVTRTFTVFDSDSQVSCVQTLTANNLQPFSPATIIWPDNLTVTSCDDGDFSPEALEALGIPGRIRPTFTEPACSNVAVSVSKDWAIEADFVLEPNTCSQILRSWTIIDWCGPLVNGLPPTYEWQQIINITENQEPKIMDPTCFMETFAATSCDRGTGMANFGFAIYSEDNCSATTATVVEQLFYSGPPTLVATNISQGGVFSSSSARPNGYPVGDHKFIITVSDVCGNSSSCEKVVRIVDTQEPTVSCNDLSIPVQIWNQVPMVVLSAPTLAEVTYGCAVYIPEVSFSATENIDQQIIMCDEINSDVISVKVYVTDDFGLETSCEAQITVTQQDLCNTTNNNNDILISDCQSGSPENFEIDCNNGGSFNLPFNIIDELNTCPSNLLTLVVNEDLNSDGQNLNTFESENFLEINVFTPGQHTYTITGYSCDGSTRTCTRQISVECISPTLLSVNACRDTDFAYLCETPEIYTNPVTIGANDACDMDVTFEARVTFPNGDTELIVNLNSVDIVIDPDFSGLGLYTYTVEATGCGTTALCSGSVFTTCAIAGSNSIAGKVTTESAQLVEEVELVLEDSNVNPEYTDDQGSYAFAEMPAGGTYKISASKDIDPLVSVSTLDLIMMQRHILGINLLDSPYKLIAADIDNSGSINGIDLIELRKLILGIYDTYPENNSWRIIDANQQLGDDPFVVEIKENYIIPQLNSDMEIDFIGVKVGDVDQSFTQFNNQVLNQRLKALTLVTREKSLQPGIRESVIVSATDFNTLNGLQLQIDFDTDKVAVIELNPLDNNLSLDNFNVDNSGGSISMVWHNVKATSFEGDLFELVLLPYEASALSSVMSVNESRIAAEAYSDTRVDKMTLTFSDNNEVPNELLLMQNSPNPWSEQTEINYYLPQASPTTLSVYDISGRLVFKVEREGVKGLNSVRLDKDDLNTQGVLYYELVTENGRKIEKMILMD